MHTGRLLHVSQWIHILLLTSWQTLSFCTPNEGCNVHKWIDVGFYRAALNASVDYSYEKGICLSVRPSFKRVICDKTEERSVQILIPYERSFRIVL